MPTVALYNMEGKEVGTIELSEKIFAAPVNEPVVHEVVKNYLANQRQGTQSTKTRTEVRGGGIKPWRQKGTGRARQGSIRAVQWIKGGIAFAPKPRDFSKKLNKKARTGAFLSALSKKVADGELVVVDKIELEQPKTKLVAEILKNFNYDKRTLFVVADKDDNLLRAGRNIEKLTISVADLVNVYEVVVNANIVMTKDAIKKIEEANV